MTTDSTKIADARLELRAAHSARKQAIENLEAARDAAARGRAVLDAADADLRDRMAESSAAETSSAAALARSIRNGDDVTNVVDLSDDKPAEALARAQSRHAIAEKAHAALTTDVTAAETALRSAEAAVERAAVAVVAAEANALIDELRPAVATARECELRFLALERLMQTVMLDTGAPLAPALREAKKILERPNHLLTSLPQLDPESVATRKMVAYLSALRADPSAEFNSVRDPLARVPAQAAE